jgi:galactose mutarotase-like enzyme
MSQHGFARDMDFTLVESRDNILLFELSANEATKELYPADFTLEISYELKENKVIVGWKVTNNDNNTIHFQIGAHPAFNYKNFDPNAEIQAYFNLLPLDTSYRLSTITEGGCIGPDITKVIYKEHCIIPITKETFNNDALILEDSQVMSVELLDAQRVPYLKLEFDAPVLGLWSPTKNSYAPFVCIEPWFGRCDRVGYEGEFRDKDWTMHLDKKNSFKTYYSIEII